MNKYLSVDEIRNRFDHDVERFSNLETGQEAVPDGALLLHLVADAAAMTPDARSVLDIGCGAGNYTLRLLQRLPNLDVTLCDLSQPMLDRARQRVGAATGGCVKTVQGDVRDIDLGQGKHDVVIAAMVLHHLRDADQWKDVFTRIYQSLRPGGCFWIADFVNQATPPLDAISRRLWSDHLVQLGGEAYRDKVFDYSGKEDTPRPLLWQIDLLRKVGFESIDVLHKNACAAVFGGLRGQEAKE